MKNISGSHTGSGEHNQRREHGTDARKPRVAFDHRIFAFQRHGGVSRYFARLVEYLPEFCVDPKIIAPLHLTQYLKDLPRGSVWGQQITPSDKGIRRASVLGEILHRPLALLYGADIVHETYFHYRRVAPAKAKIVTTVYDMIHEMSPAGAGIKRNLEIGVARADKIICISQNTLQDLLRVHPEVESKAEVVLLGFDHNSQPDLGSPSHHKPYLLYVGVRSYGYKNFEGLIAAYSASQRLHENFDLICAGGGELTPEEQSLIEKSGLGGKVFRREADDKTLQNLYRHAHVFVYPSLYEGFGMPPLEAMAADCPVVCMQVSSLPEVCGDAAEYAVPDQPESLQAAIERVALSAERANTLRAAGRERLKLFSWRECARQTSEIYKSLM